MFVTFNIFFPGNITILFYKTYNGNHHISTAAIRILLWREF